MSPADPPQSFVDNYIKLIADRDTGNFQKVLDMKVNTSNNSPFLLRFIIQSLVFMT